MATETLRIDITANNKAAVAALKQTTTELGNVTAASNKTAAAAVASGTGMSKAAVNYQNFGRVIQDLPYGFTGIQNNLTQLIPSVGMLGIAFTGVVTALTFAQVGLGAWTRGLGASNTATDEAIKANKEMAKSYAEERGQLDSLYRTATNDNQARNIRLDAIKQLRDNYGAYLKNFSDEEILAGKAAIAYTNLANAIMMKARASAAQSKIDKIVADNLENELKIIEIMNKANKDAAAIKGDRRTVTTGTGGMGAGQVSKVLAEELIGGIFYRASLEVAKYSKEINTASQALKFLQDQIQANQISPFTEDRQASGKATATGRQDYGTSFTGGKAKKMQTISEPLGGENTLDVLNMKIQAGSAYNDILAQQLQNETLLNEQMMISNQLSELGASLFTSMGNALLYGQDMGEAFTNVLKKMVMDLAAAVAQALIFQAIMAAITSGGSVTAGGTGPVGGAFNGMQLGGSGGGNGILGFLSGQNIFMSQNRTRTSRGFRVGG